MNRAVKQFTSAALTLAMLMSMGVAASAKATSSKGTLTRTKTSSTTAAQSAPTASPVTTTPTATPNDYSINVTQNQVQFVRGGKAVGTYAAKSSDMKLMLSQAGNLVLNFIKDDGKAVNVSLGQQKFVNLSGNCNTLTIDGSVPNNRAFAVSGTVGTLNVNAPVAVSLKAEASVASLKVGSGTAKVSLESGAKVTKASAVTASSVSGFSGSVTKMQAVAAPSATTINAASKKTGLKVGGSTSTSASNAGKEQVYLDMSEDDNTKNTEEINFTTNNGVELIAKDGVSLGLAMKDVVLKVTHDTDKDNDRVGGSWKWVDVASTTHTSGTYTYRFYPSLSSKYPTVDVKVKYVGNGQSNSSKTLGKPSISFANKSHGEAGKDIRIDVRIPSGVDDDSTITIYVDRDAYNEWNLDEDDAGEEKSYTVYIPSNYDDDDEVRIQAKVKTDSRTTSSNTIKYRIDGDSSSTNLNGFSISAPDRSIKPDESVDISVNIPSGVTNPRLTTKVTGGNFVSESGVSAGNTATVKVRANKKTGTMKVRITLKCDQGSPSDTVSVDVRD